MTSGAAVGHEQSARTRNAYWFYGDLVVVRLSGEETEGRFTLLEWLQPPGEMTPLHVHRTADQTPYVLEGELTLHLPGKTMVVGPGECGYLPRNVPHAEWVTSPGPARLLEVVSPAGFERFVAAVGEPALELTLPPAVLTGDLDRIEALAAEHDLELLGPPGALP